MNSSIPKRSPQTGGSLRTLNDQNRSQDNFTAVLSLTHTFNSDGGVLDALWITCVIDTRKTNI